MIAQMQKKLQVQVITITAQITLKLLCRKNIRPLNR